jgi:mono/diheme cytochrome c family protein
MEVHMMTFPWTRGIAGAWLLVGAVGVGAAAQTPPAQQPAAQKPTVKATHAPPIVSVEGKDNYDAYCAVCHGRDAKGNGPAAPALKVPVPDLTTIAVRNKGKFDPLAVEDVIRKPGKTATPAHGVEDMPVWGAVFSTEDRSQTLLRIRNLVRYLESIQVPKGAGRP